MSKVEQDTGKIGASRTALIAQKEDVFAAIRALERDHTDGAVDAEAYEAARHRYEIEAADILERIDQLDATPSPTAAIGDRRRLGPIAFGAFVLVALAIGIFLFAALRERGSSDPLTGSAPLQPATPVPAAIIAAQQVVQQQPRSMSAYLTLGNAYLTANNPSLADRAFLTAMQLDPGSPEPITMHALVLGSAQNRIAAALVLLRGVERTHPAFTHVWLVDGLLSSRPPPAYSRAIAAYKRFLELAPHSSVAPDVRALLAGLERTQRSKR